MNYCQELPFQIFLHLKAFWESGRPVAFTQWLQKTAAIDNVAYHTEVVKRNTVYLYAHFLIGTMRDDITDKLGRSMVQPYSTDYSTHTGPEVAGLVNSLAEDYSNSSWINIVERMNHYQPDPKFHCTMAIINPFTSRLEWIRVRCDDKYNISTILCEKQVRIIPHMQFSCFEPSKFPINFIYRYDII